jgi:DNA-binding SARP family transcriptional activator
MNAEFAVLGPLKVRRSGRPVPLRAGKQRILLADLETVASTAIGAATSAGPQATLRL